MKFNIALFAGLTFFFLPVGVVYGLLTNFEEPVGFAALLLCAGMSALVGVYLWMTAQRIDTQPGDDPTALIEDGAGEQGFFSPHSWWPLALGAAAGVVFLGLAIGWWIVYFGMGFAALALVGWVYEYYRGAHAH